MPNDKNEELDSTIEQIMHMIEKSKEPREPENRSTLIEHKKRMDDYLYQKELDKRMRDIDLYVPPFHHTERA